MQTQKVKISKWALSLTRLLTSIIYKIVGRVIPKSYTAKIVNKILAVG